MINYQIIDRSPTVLVLQIPERDVGTAGTVKDTVIYRHSGYWNLYLVYIELNYLGLLPIVSHQTDNLRTVITLGLLHLIVT